MSFALLKSQAITSKLDATTAVGIRTVPGLKFDCYDSYTLFGIEFPRRMEKLSSSSSSPPAFIYYGCPLTKIESVLRELELFIYKGDGQVVVQILYSTKGA